MVKLFLTLLFGLILLVPAPAQAAEFKLNLTVVRQPEGATVGELWFNDRILWRIRLMSDDAQPAATIGPSQTIVVVPDIDDGLFKLKVYQQ